MHKWPHVLSHKQTTWVCDYFCEISGVFENGQEEFPFIVLSSMISLPLAYTTLTNVCQKWMHTPKTWGHYYSDSESPWRVWGPKILFPTSFQVTQWFWFAGHTFCSKVLEQLYSNLQEKSWNLECWMKYQMSFSSLLLNQLRTSVSQSKKGYAFFFVQVTWKDEWMQIFLCLEPVLFSFLCISGLRLFIMNASMFIHQ